MGNLVVGGYTNSNAAFPTTANALQGSYQGGQFDGFVLVYDATLTTLLYSTYLGGTAGRSFELRPGPPGPHTATIRASRHRVNALA